MAPLQLRPGPARDAGEAALPGGARLPLRPGEPDGARRRARQCPGLDDLCIVREWNEPLGLPAPDQREQPIFLAAFERRYGQTLKTLRGDVPGTDYAVGATGTASEIAVNRDAHDLLLAAEKWATVASLQGGYDYPSRRSTRPTAMRSTMTSTAGAWPTQGRPGPGRLL